LPRRPVQRFACLSLVFSLLSIAQPAHAQDGCMTRDQMRALALTLADIASERILERCMAIEAIDAPFMQRNGPQITGHLNPLRSGAADILIAKYAPFLASRKSLALQAIEPVLEIIIERFALDKLTAQSCSQLDITLEALSFLEPSQTADMLTVYMARSPQVAGQDAGAFKLCTDKTP